MFMMTTSSRTSFWMVKKAIVALVCLAAVSNLWAAPRQILSGQLPPNLAALRSIDRLPETSQLSLAVGLPLNNREGLTNMLEQLYNPTSTYYRQWLTTAQFTERFGPTEKDYEAVAAFLQSHGLTVTGKYSNRMLIN